MQIGNFNLSIISLKFKPVDKDYRFYGSYYRGMLGRNLKRRFCVLRDMECKECPLSDKCLYMLSFEKYKDILFPPYIINRSSKDSLRITLIGSFTQFSEIYMDAFKRLNLQEAGFYNPFSNKIESKKLILNSEHFATFNNFSNEIMVEVKFIRLKKDSKMLPCEDFTFETLLKAVEKRVYLTNKYYGNPNLKVYLPKVEIEYKKNDCRYEKIYRYSNRQKRKMLIPSMSAKFLITKGTKELFPYLYLASFLNIGTNASMGFGSIYILAR